MKLIYIAGKYRDSNSWDIEQNIRRAETLSLEVAKLGLMPVCPHTQSRFFYGTLTEDFWMEGTLEILRRCDAVLVCGDPKKSKGTLGEIGEASLLDIPVFFSIKELKSWIK